MYRPLPQYSTKRALSAQPHTSGQAFPLSAVLRTSQSSRFLSRPKTKQKLFYRKRGSNNVNRSGLFTSMSPPASCASQMRGASRIRWAMVLSSFGGMALLSFMFVSLTVSQSPSSSLSETPVAPVPNSVILFHENSDHRHPFVPPRLRQRSLFSALSGDSSNDPTPRYLVFGTSSTYGVGLEQPAKEAYPRLLSPAAHNAASPSGGFTLAASCTQSIVRDNAYDVIVVEFQEWDNNLSILTRRLRQRFPHAFLVFLRLWHPSQLKYQHNSTTAPIDFHEFRRVNGNRAMDDPELYLKVLATKERWSFAKPDDENVVLDEAQRYGASYFAMNVPDNDLFEYPKTMMDQLSIFQESSDNLNAQGHAVVAASLRSVLQTNKFSPEKSRQLGDWGVENGGGDECRLWYENGLYHAEQDTKRLRRVEFSKAGGSRGGDWFVGADHKHALEVDNQQGSTLRINNPFPQERMLYLTYLTTPAPPATDEDKETKTENPQQSNPPASKDYPQLRLRINDKPAILIEAMHNTPSAPVEDDRHREELARTSAVGMVPPGRSVVHLDPLVLGRDKSGSRAFRLLGWSLLPHELEGQLEWEFSLEQSRLPAQEYWNWFGGGSTKDSENKIAELER